MIKNSTPIDDRIDSLLDQVLASYPPERVQNARSRLEDAWHGVPRADRIPYTVTHLPPQNRPPLPATAYPTPTASQYEKDLIEQLYFILEHATWDDDFFPALAPGIRQLVIPSYFGCVEDFASEEMSSRVHPLIQAPEDVNRLPTPGFSEGTAGFEMLEKMRYFRQRTRGLLYLYETDMQGPFSVASQVWGVQDFLMALHTSPREVHVLLQKCTEAIIEYFHLMEDAADGMLIPFHCHPFLWFPRDRGVAVSEDLAAVVSPKVLREFIRPYLEQLSDAFGGVVMHSCGSLNRVVGELNQVRGLVGVNFASTETDLEQYAAAARPDMVLVVHNSPVNLARLPLLSPWQHLELCRKVFQQRGGRGVSIVSPVEPWTGQVKAEKDSAVFQHIAQLML